MTNNGEFRYVVASRKDGIVWSRHKTASDARLRLSRLSKANNMRGFSVYDTVSGRWFERTDLTQAPKNGIGE